MKKVLNIILLLSLMVCSCSAKPSEKSTDKKSYKTNLYIREIIEKYYSDRDFMVGASGRTEYLRSDSPMFQRWLKEFSYNTPENDFKQSKVYIKPGAEWRNQDYMKFIDIARRNGQTIRAHGPISPQCSKWIKDDTRTAAEMEQVLTEFMTRLSQELQANKDVVKMMDVVNETFAGSRQKGIGYDASHGSDDVVYNAEDWFGPRLGTDKWENPWTVMGFDETVIDGQPFRMPKYIRKAFVIAQANAPDIKMIYNEHGKTINPALWDRLKKTVIYLRSQGIRIDGIGWQAHVDLGWEREPQNVQNLRDVIAWCNENGLEFHITELDVTVSRKESSIDTEKLNSTREEQAQTIGAVLEVMLQNIGKGARGVNFWTMAERFHDGNTFAVLFDAEGNPLPAYQKVKELLMKYAQ